MRGIIVVTWLAAACIAAGCSRQQSAWDAARRQDTVSSYEAYLARYPAGARAEQARAALRALRDDEAWSRADRLATPEAWQRYLGEFPDGRHAAEARGRLIAFIPPGPKPADGRYVVQLGAWSSEASARAARDRALESHAAGLADTELLVVAPREDPAAVWRLRTASLEEETARDLCSRLRLLGVDCVPLPVESAGQPAP
jgi:hypothetical protein